MDVNTVKSFIKFLKESRYDEFEMKDGEMRLSLKFEPPARNPNKTHGIDSVARKDAKPAGSSEKKHDSQGADEFVKIITSPIVGRFYSTMTADKLQPIRKGDPVKKNQKICMIEAMNIEHEISSPYGGVMEDMLVDEGDAVMYGQPLFKIRLA